MIVQVLQVRGRYISNLDALVKEKGLSREDLTLILNGARIHDVECVNDEVLIRAPYERRMHTEDSQTYFDTLAKNSERLSGIAFEEI